MTLEEFKKTGHGKHLEKVIKGLVEKLEYNLDIYTKKCPLNRKGDFYSITSKGEVEVFCIDDLRKIL